MTQPNDIVERAERYIAGKAEMCVYEKPTRRAASNIRALLERIAELECDKTNMESQGKGFIDQLQKYVRCALNNEKALLDRFLCTNIRRLEFNSIFLGPVITEIHLRKLGSSRMKQIKTSDYLEWADQITTEPTTNEGE